MVEKDARPAWLTVAEETMAQEAFLEGKMTDAEEYAYLAEINERLFSSNWR